MKTENFKRGFLEGRKLLLQFRTLTCPNLCDAKILQIRERISTLRYCSFLLHYRTATLKTFAENINEDSGSRDGALC
jgi:hypothetical protein